jgi:steroid Delta-isomerase
MADDNAIHATIDAYLAAFPASDRAGYIACFGDDAWVEDPVGTPRRTGRDEIGAFWDETHAGPDRIELRPTGPRVVVGSEAAFTFEARATVAGDTYVVDVIDVLTFDDAGRIATLRAFFDPGSLRPSTA